MKSILVIVALLAVLVLSGCASDAYSAAHTGVNLVDSFLIWDRMPGLDVDWFVNPYGLLNDALDPTVWGNQPIQSGW